MMYSSAIYPSAESTLEEAAVHKLDTICQKLVLQPGDLVIEIGTGWGGFAIHAAKHYGCHVTTTTISKEQLELAQERVRAEGLEDSITLLFDDYRDLAGQFDKLVSIEMIEAVGPQFLDSYFSQINALLKPDGLALVQAINMPEQRYQRALKTWTLSSALFFLEASFLRSVQSWNRCAMSRIWFSPIQKIRAFIMPARFAIGAIALWPTANSSSPWGMTRRSANSGTFTLPIVKPVSENALSAYHSLFSPSPAISGRTY